MEVPEPRQAKYPHKPYKYTEAEYLAFEKRSNENMVHFHQKELRKILKGSLAKDALAARDRRHLTKHGILTRTERGVNRPLTLSLPTVEILASI